MNKLPKMSNKQLWEHIEAIEGEREQIIDLLNEALDICCPNECKICIWKHYCRDVDYKKA